MTGTREQFRELMKEKAKEKSKVNGQSGNLEFLVQAQVKMENLTGDQYWDRFLSLVQAGLDKMKAQEVSLRDALCSPGMVDPNDIMAIKLSLANVGGQIASLEMVLQLPTDIINSGEQAKNRLDG